MRKRRVLLICIAIVLVSGMFVFLWNGEREPEYGGRKLSEWVEMLPPYPWDEIQTEPVVCIRQIGTNGLAYLLKWIAWGPSRWKTEFYETKGRLLNKRSATWMNTEPGFLRGEKAARAFQILGSMAKSAI